MKLLQVGPKGAERPAMLDADGVLRDLSAHVAAIDGHTLSEVMLSRLAALDPVSFPRVTGNPRIGACVSGVGKFVCIGLNYVDHARETGKTPPPEPIVFMKATSAISGPNDPIEAPRGHTRLDWEV